MTKAIHIPADESEPLTNRECHSLEDWQDAVGGSIESVANDEVGMFANEEGLIHGLAYNARATQLARAFGIPTEGLVGDVVVFGPVDEDGDNTDVPDVVAALANSIWGVAAGASEADRTLIEQAHSTAERLLDSPPEQRDPKPLDAVLEAALDAIPADTRKRPADYAWILADVVEQALPQLPEQAGPKLPWWENDRTWSTKDGGEIPLEDLSRGHRENIRRILTSTPQPGLRRYLHARVNADFLRVIADMPDESSAWVDDATARAEDDRRAAHDRIESLSDAELVADTKFIRALDTFGGGANA